MNTKIIVILIFSSLITGSVCYLAYNAYISSNSNQAIESKKINNFQDIKNKKINNEGLELRDVLKRENAKKDLKEINKVLKNFTDTYKIYTPTQTMCLALSNISGVVGFPVSYTKLENNIKYQELALQYNKIDEASQIMWQACQFNINDISNINDNSILFKDYLELIKPIAINI